MPRTKPTSTWNNPSDITSTWGQPRAILGILGPTFDSNQITWDSTAYTFDSTGSLAKSIRDWDTDRYAEFFLDNLGQKVLQNT